MPLTWALGGGPGGADRREVVGSSVGGMADVELVAFALGAGSA